MNRKIVSIIVPIYKVEDHLERCVRSLMEQNYTDIEYVFVNDASPDGSLSLLHQILSDYPERAESVKIISHDVNKGLPAARNSGMNLATGDYIFHCDSDDWVDRYMISDLIAITRLSDIDILYTDFYLSFKSNERYMHQPKYENPMDCLIGMLCGSMKFNVWNKLIRRSLYVDNGITFPEGNSMGEDMTILKLFCKAETVKYVPQSYYHYMQTNPNAYTKRFSKAQLIDIQCNLENVVEYIHKHVALDLTREIEYFKLTMKLPLLISLDTKMYALWRNWFPEANLFIKSNPAFSLRTKLVQYAALKHQDWLVKLYNQMVIRFVYGIIFR